MKQQILLSIVIPIYCEQENIELVYYKIGEVLHSIIEPIEIIFVDDGSKDQTWEKIVALSQQNNNIRAIRFSRNFGKEMAIRAGLEASRGQAVIVMDGDLQHPPQHIPEMLEKWQKQGYKIVEAVKEHRGQESYLYKMAAKIFYHILSIMARYDLQNSSDFKLLDRQVVDEYLRMGEAHLFFRGICEWLGFEKAQIPFYVGKREKGTSKWSLRKLITLASNVVTSFSSFPLVIVNFIGYIFLLFSIVLGTQALWFKIIGKSVEGFTTVILILLITGSMILISLGIIGRYIAKIYEEVKRRPKYIIGDTIQITGKE